MIETSIKIEICRKYFKEASLIQKCTIFAKRYNNYFDIVIRHW